MALPVTSRAGTSTTSNDFHGRLFPCQLTSSSTVSSDDQDYEYSLWKQPPAFYITPPASYFKLEPSQYPFNMSSVPAAPPIEPAKHEYPEDSALEESTIHTGNGRIEMDQDEVDAIIRNKRKVRDPKACYACHRRKVKCDRNLPCDSCVKRDHPELCSYERPTKKKRLALTSNINHGSDGCHSDGQDITLNSGPNVTVPKEQWERINLELQRLRTAVSGAQGPLAATSGPDSDEPRSTSRSDFAEGEGIHAPSTQMGTMHLGSRSVLAYMMGNRTKSSQDAARALLEDDILPNLGLDNETATYPFVDLWSTDSSIQDVNGLCKALPEDNLCISFWESYRDVACTIYPVVPDKAAFQQTLKDMLDHRAFISSQNLHIDPNKPYGVSMSWLALVFSVFASGAQCSTLPAQERELTSQVYICCAYQALRMANFLTHPCLETIEACLIIGNALAYNMNPGVAYVFLGMTLRSALSMGLHVNSQSFSEQENYLRGRIWWALAWQDSHFSVSYDRPSSSIMCFPEIPYTKYSSPGNRSYVETMSAIIKLTQDILRDRTMSPTKAMSFPAIQKYKDQTYRIIADAHPRLKERANCVSTTDHMERLAFKLHSSYMLSEICRPALREQSQPSATSQPNSGTPVASPKQGGRTPSFSAQSPTPSVTTPADPSVQKQLRAECIKNLEGTVEAFVELHDYSIFACRSWIGIQRSISAAFLLGILPESRQEPRVLKVLQNLEKRIAQRASEDVGFDPNMDYLGSPMLQNSRRMSLVNNGSRPGMSESPNWLRSMTKSLHALGKLNAALASSGSSSTQSGMQESGYPQYSHQMQQQQQHQKQQQAVSIYASPGVSPISRVQKNDNVSAAMSSTANQYVPINLPAHMQTSHVSHSQTMGSPTGGYRTGVGMGPITPDSTASGSNVSDWHYGNLTEHALEYVQPGLWG